MYNKIVPVILNTGKNASFSDVYVAQPDSLKENLAGKIFILAEINAKKNEGRLIFDFLIESLDNYYYNDEKILLKDKIEGLKLENIFEAALSKVNKDLNEFLITKKIKINAPSSSITIGVIFENVLYFSSFGKNRALLIYRRNNQYEVINVETSAADQKEYRTNEEFSSPKEINIFSSVISGEIPINSYFFFTSEALPEYLSNKELISIITKLPPIVAAEQIKNTLEKINVYVPFLGVLIKNTIGLNIIETKEELEETLITHSTASTLNNTEQKTEQILAPAGLISFSKMVRKTKEFFGPRSDSKSPNLKKSYKPEEEKASVQLPLNIGNVKALNLARSDSFLAQEKIFFKKKPGEFFLKLKNVTQIIGQIFNPQNWLALIFKLRDWFKSLNLKNSLLFSGLIVVLLIFFSSLIFTNIKHKNQATQNTFNSAVTAIENLENSIDAHLLYNDNNGARVDLITAQALISSLPHEKNDQKAIYDNLNNKLTQQSEKIEKIVHVVKIEKTNDLTGLNLNSLFLTTGKLYATDQNNIYSLTVNSSLSNKFTISGVTNLGKAYQNPSEKGFLYFLNNNQIVKFDLKKKTTVLINIISSDSSTDFNTFKTYGSNGKNLYVLNKANNQIYKYSKTVNGYSTKTNWLKETSNLSNASDLFVIDGDLYVLNNTGEVQKFYDGKKVDYNAPALIPVMTKANKMFIGVKYIYLFDGVAKRLAVLNKINGDLLNQYEVASLNNLKDFTVNEEEKNAYFLADGGIYRINLNQ